MENTTIIYKNINTLLLLGGGRILIETALHAQNKGFIVFVFTAQRQLDDILTDSGESFESLLNKDHIQFITTNDINTCDAFFERIDENALAIGFGEVWTFTPEIIDKFDKRLIDYMGIPLPRYRGGAHYTWAMLSKEKKWGSHFQIINEQMVQGEFDSGEIILSNSYDLPANFDSPNDFFNYAIAEEIKFIDHFLNALVSKKTLNLCLIDESQSLFFPRLHTLKNGWINWQWNHAHICLFIQAFDKPYIGASTYLNGKERVHLQGCHSLNQSSCDFHPYMSGLITQVTSDGVQVVAGNQLIQIKEVLDVNAKKITASLKPGERLFTPQTMIEKSMLDQVSYDKKPELTPLPHVVSERLFLRKLSIKDCTVDYLSWLQDEKVNQYLETRWQQQTLNSIKEFVEQINNDSLSHLFGIFEKQTNRHIGNIKIGPINLNHSYADISYFIGEQSYWGNGFATEAIKSMVNYAWQSLGLKTLQAGVYSGNIASQKVLKNNGFELQGKIMQQLEGANGREDHLWYSLSNDNA